MDFGKWETERCEEHLETRRPMRALNFVASVCILGLPLPPCFPSFQVFRAPFGPPFSKILPSPNIPISYSGYNPGTNATTDAADADGSPRKLAGARNFSHRPGFRAPGRFSAPFGLPSQNPPRPQLLYQQPIKDTSRGGGERPSFRRDTASAI